MDETDESSWEEVERLGPYQLREQVPLDEPGRGELFRARNETSGTTALLFKPAEADGAEPLTDWRERCVSSASPGYLALEVEQTPWSVAPDKQSTETLLCTLEDVLAGVRRMSQAVSSNDPRRWRHLGWVMAGVASACVLGFSEPDAVASAPAPMDQEAPPDTAVLDAFTSSLGDTRPRDSRFSPGPCLASPSRGRSVPPALATRRSSWWVLAGYLTS
ncbi:hypothetical protein [Archangium violaceum]|uniref:hypothetical protein n=1 Tax=Archangium violaceum TaxID=83451 RepID=UPI001EF0BEDF|nr:hypothetical protein [Archangium violaceum]